MVSRRISDPSDQKDKAKRKKAKRKRRVTAPTRRQAPFSFCLFPDHFPSKKRSAATDATANGAKTALGNAGHCRRAAPSGRTATMVTDVNEANVAVAAVIVVTVVVSGNAILRLFIGTLLEISLGPREIRSGEQARTEQH
jgi:hypothetical protein